MKNVKEIKRFERKVEEDKRRMRENYKRRRDEERKRRKKREEVGRGKREERIRRGRGGVEGELFSFKRYVCFRETHFQTSGRSRLDPRPDW